MSKDEIKNLIASYDEEFKDVKGYSHSAEYKDEYFVEKTTIDYTKADKSKLNNIQGITIDGDSKDISMKKSEEHLLSQGFTKK